MEAAGSLCSPAALLIGRRGLTPGVRRTNRTRLPEARAALPTRGPERADDHFRVVERVVQVATERPDVDATKSRHWRLIIEGADGGKGPEELGGFLKFCGEEPLVVAVGQPPLVFALHMARGRSCETNAAFRQRERSSRSTSAASAKRPSDTSMSDSARAACKAARSPSSSQSPGSSGSNSTSVPSGRVVGSSSTRRPPWTRALIVTRAE